MEEKIMVNWNNLDTLKSFRELENVKKINLAEAMTGEGGAERVKKFTVPMACGLEYNYAAKEVDESILDALKALAEEAQLARFVDERKLRGLELARIARCVRRIFEETVRLVHGQSNFVVGHEMIRRLFVEDVEIGKPHHACRRFLVGILRKRLIAGQINPGFHVF